MLALFASIAAVATWAVFPATLYEAPTRSAFHPSTETPALFVAVAHAETAESPSISKLGTSVATTVVQRVPFFSQFTDITSPAWQKVGCGITDLTMLIHYYRPDASVTVDQMLTKGIAAGAYDYTAGWTYRGLINLGKPYGLTGTWYTLPGDSSAALERFKLLLADGPVILSVHYKFDPKSTIPHLVVINGIKDGTVYYNDPATTKGTKEISLADFLKGWKRKVIVIRPVVASGEAALAER